MTVLSALLHERRFQPHWRLLLLLAAAATAWFAFGASEPTPPRDGADKIDHLLAFGTLACIGTLSLRPGRLQAGAAAALLVAYGALIEIVQMRLPGRHASWGDLLADVAGIAIGLMLAALLRRTWRARNR